MLRTVFLGSVAALTLAGSTVAAPPAAPPLSAYGALPAIEAATLSPDGQKLAYITVIGETRALLIRSVVGQPLAAVAFGTAKVRNLDFADNSRLLITTSLTDRPEIPNWQTPVAEWFQAHSYDLTTKKLVTLLSNTDRALNATAGDPVAVRDAEGAHVLVPAITFVSPAARMDLYRVSLSSGVGRIVSTGEPRRSMDWIVAPDGTLVARTSYAQIRGKWNLEAKTPDGWRSLDSTSTLIDRPSVLGLGRDGGSVVMSREIDGERALVEVSLTDASVTEVADGADLNSVVFHPRTWRLAGVGTIRDMVEYRFFDPELARLWAKVRPAFPNKQVRPQSWSDDFSRLVVSVEGKDDTGSYYLVDMATMKASLIGDPYPAVRSAVIGEVRPIRYKAADGLEIPAYLTLPPGREAKGLPLVVLPHGGPQSRDTLGFDWWAQALASRGYAVLQPNFRGSSGYGLSFVKAGYGEWGRKMQTDLSDGVRHLAAEGVIDPARVCIMGGSYGGYAALAGAAIDTNVYRCAVSVNGVADLRTMLSGEARDAGEKSSTVRYWNRFMGVDKRGDRALDDVSPARKAADVKIPVLLVHGRDDTVVPFQQSRMMHQALQRAGKDSTLVTLDGEDHWLSRADTRQRMLESAVGFIQKHNPA